MPLGFLVFPYLFFSLTDKKTSKINKIWHFIYGTSFGLGLNIIILYWIRAPFLFDPSTVNYAPLSFLLIFYVSIFFGFVFLILSYFKNDFCKLIMMPVAFVIAEIIREKFLFGFPWVTFAIIVSSNHYLLQAVYYIGTNGLSFLVIFLFLIPVSLLILDENKIKIFPKIYLIFSFIILIVFFFLIFFRFYFANESNTNNEVNFSLNQLNINQFDRKNSLLKKNRINEIINIIRNNENTIYIFSESDYPYIINGNNIVYFFQKYLLNNNSIIIGGIRKDNKKYYNSMYYISNNYFEFFDKKKLVPFGEFLPFRKKLNFLEAIVGKTDLEQGKKNRIIKTVYNFNFIPIICYEIIFFNDLLTVENQNSPILINITNDAWFDKYLGPYQHFYLSRIRSIELNKFLIRVSNNGVSAIINNYGKIINIASIFGVVSKQKRAAYSSTKWGIIGFTKVVISNTG